MERLRLEVGEQKRALSRAFAAIDELRALKVRELKADMQQSFQPSFNRSRQVRLQWCMAMVVKLGISSTYSMSSAPLRRLSRSIGYA